jgi:orotate phosphoribosyltransferase
MELGSFFAEMMMDRGFIDNTDIILGPSYKGSAIALATSIALYTHFGYDVLFEYDRKEAKSHGEGSKAGSMMVNRTLFDGCRIFVVDDVTSSMATKYDLVNKIRMEAEINKMGVKIVGIGIAVDREQTTAVYDSNGEVVLNQKGENTIQSFMSKTGIPVYSVAGIREIVDYLFTEKISVMINGSPRPIDDETKFRFDEYLTIYGNE